MNPYSLHSRHSRQLLGPRALGTQQEQGKNISLGSFRHRESVRTLRLKNNTRIIGWLFLPLQLRQIPLCESQWLPSLIWRSANCKAHMDPAEGKPQTWQMKLTITLSGCHWPKTFRTKTAANLANCDWRPGVSLRACCWLRQGSTFQKMGCLYFPDCLGTWPADRLW